LPGRLTAFPQLIEQSHNSRLRVGFQPNGNAREPTKGILAVVDLDNFLAILKDLAEMCRPLIQARAYNNHGVAFGQRIDSEV
jgi:hypothetical protein